MKKHWKAAGIVILTLVCGLFAWNYWAGVKADRQHAADEARFNREIAALKRDLPLGTRRPFVTAYARNHQLEFRDYGKNATFSFARIASNIWYCSYWDAAADIEFADASPDAVLIRLSPSTPGMCL